MKSGRRRVGFLLGVLLALQLGAGNGQEIPSDTTKLPAQLAEYYGRHDRVSFDEAQPEPTVLEINKTAALAGMADKDDAKAKAAGDCLVAMMAQALADENSGTAGWHATPFWGGEAENPARELRKGILAEISQRLSEAPPAQTVGVVIPLAWFVRSERVVSFRAQSLNLLEKIGTPQADTLMLSFAGDSSLPHGIQAGAIKQAATRGVEVPDAVLRVALTDCHADLRNAAREYWQKRRQGELPATFDPLTAVAQPRITGLLDGAAALVPDLPAADAPWVRVETTWQEERDGKMRQGKSSEYGWQLEQQGKRLRLLNLHGRVLWIRLGKQPDDGWRLRQTTTRIVEPPEERVKFVEAIRAGGDSKASLSENGEFSAQFQGTAAGVPEMLVAVQLYRAKQLDLCARVLLPALDSHAEDGIYLEVVKHHLADVCGQSMLVAFIGGRDYAEALRIAAVIDRLYQGTRYADDARRFLSELPQRREDFHSLTLPTRAKWESWRKKHSREEQIQYLCERLQLLNCYQYGQPDDVDLFDAQYAEPCELSPDATYRLGHGKTKVINPLIELLGNAGYEDRGDEDSKPERIPGMHLGIRDVPAMAPFLREDRLILAVGFWRTFHPSRTLTGTRELLAWVLRVAAKRELVDVREWRTLDAAKVDERIGRIIAWAQERKDKTETDLLLETLEDPGKRNASWLDAENAAIELAGRHERRAVPLLGRWLGNDQTKDYQKEEILSVMRETDAREAKPWAAEFLNGKGRPRGRAEAAFILLAAGDRERAFQVLGEVFPEFNYSNVSAENLRKYADILAKDQTPQAWNTLARLFDGIGYATISDFNSEDLCRKLESHGNPAGLQAYRKLLDNMETGIPNMVGWGTPIAYLFGDKLLKGYAPPDRTAKKILAGTKPESEQRLKATREWLDARIKKATAKRQEEPTTAPKR